MNGVDAARRLEAPAAVERVQRPRAVQLKRVAFDLRQAFGVLARRVAAETSIDQSVGIFLKWNSH